MNTTMIMAMTLAAVMSRDAIVEQLEDSVNEYKVVKTEDAFRRVVMFSMLLLLKEQSLSNPNGVMGVIEDFEESKAIIDLLKPKEC